MTNSVSDGHLSTVLATWTYLLHSGGYDPREPSILEACKAIDDLPADEDHDAVGQGLVAAVREALEGATAFADVVEAVRRWYGDLKVATDLGDEEEREDRQRVIRRTRFAGRFPWIARIIDRFPDGSVGSHWVLVEDVGEAVHIMDPYPWDRVDDELHLPVLDFMVRWELAGLDSIRFVA
ncbi:MAG: hypothetical protein JXB39_10425 [Deltaproteobacteria bacterium]|nr:hypothetical protein [Deltaproteobacteria bacterium]